MSSVCLHIGWKSWKLIARTISPTSSLFISERSYTYSQGNMEKFWGENVRSTPTSNTSDWIESTESHVISGGGVAVCLHRAVIFLVLFLAILNVSHSFNPVYSILLSVHCLGGRPLRLVTQSVPTVYVRNYDGKNKSKLSQKSFGKSCGATLTARCVC